MWEWSGRRGRGSGRGRRGRGNGRGRRGRRRWCRPTARRNDCVVVKGDGPVTGQRSAVNGVAAQHRDRRQGKDGPLKGRTCIERRRTAHLPEDIAGLGAVGQKDMGARVGSQRRGGGLEDEDRVGVVVCVQDECPTDLQRRRGLIHTGRKRLAGADETAGGGRLHPPGRIVVRGGQVSLGASRDTIGYVNGAAGHDAGRKTGHSRAGAHAEIPADLAGAGVGDRGPGQNRETASRSRPTGATAAPAGWVTANKAMAPAATEHAATEK